MAKFRQIWSFYSLPMEAIFVILQKVVFRGQLPEWSLPTPVQIKSSATFFIY